MLTQVRIGPPGGVALWDESLFLGAAPGGDVTPPVLTSPGVSEIFAFGCYPSATTDTTGEGTAYAVITTSATTPSIAQIQAGQDHTGSAAVSSGSWSVGASFNNGAPQLGGLTHDTSYYAHYTQDDAAGNDATPVTSSQFTTSDALPTGTATGETTADGTLTVGFNTGTVWWVVTESGTAPSIAQVQAGQDDSGSAAADDGSETASNPTINTLNATGLTAGTTYYFHYQYENEDNVDSPVLSSASFETTESSAGQAGTVDASDRLARLTSVTSLVRRAGFCIALILGAL